MDLALARLKKLIEPLFPGLMGIRLLEAAPERVVGSMEVRPELCTSGGILHGGADTAFADPLGRIGPTLNRPGDTRTTTTDSSTKFIAGAKVSTTVTGES